MCFLLLVAMYSVRPCAVNLSIVRNQTANVLSVVRMCTVESLLSLTLT